MASVPLNEAPSDKALLRASDIAREYTMSSARWQKALTPDFIAEWGRLTANTAEPNPFYECWHLRAALEACDPEGTIEILQFREDGQLRGLLPIERSNDYYGRPIPHLRGWLHDNAFCGVPLVARALTAK